MTAGMHEIIAGEDGEGKRIDAYLAARFPSLSRARIQKAIARGDVRLNAVTPKKNAVLTADDRIALRMEAMGEDENGGMPMPQNIEIEFLYEDDHVVAVNKPSGMVVHPAAGARDGTLVNALLYHLSSLSNGGSSERPGIIHRLDKDTSGVLLVAKSDEAHRAFARLFAQRQIEKTYIGICIGSRPIEHGVIEAAVGRSRRFRSRQSVRADGKAAVTEYWLIAFRSGMSLLKLRPHTGRTHQIRLHCRHAGFRIIGDTTYGSDREDVLRLEPLERPFAYKVLKCFTRHALHARRIAFEHPFSGKAVSIEAPFPKDFTDAVALFGCCRGL